MTDPRPADDTRSIALSLSPPADLEALGYPPGAYDRLTFDLALHIIRNRARVLYGGHVQPDSVTVKIIDHLIAAYAVADDPPFKPVLNLLPCSELARGDLDMEKLAKRLVSYRRWLDMRLVCPEGPRPLILVADEPTPHFALNEEAASIVTTHFTTPDALQDYAATAFPDPAAALTAMRAAAEALADGRIVAGGKRGDLGVAGDKDRYSGSMPGIFEEIIGSLTRGKKCAILAAYGGAGRAAAVALGLLDPADASPWLGEKQAGVEAGLVALRALADNIPAATKHKMQEFALRDDDETLARDVVGWLVG